MTNVFYAITPKFAQQEGKHQLSLPTVTRYVSEKEKHYKVAELLEEYELADTQEAIEASSWCELAEIGEVYDGDKFTIEVIENDE